MTRRWGTRALSVALSSSLFVVGCSTTKDPGGSAAGQIPAWITDGVSQARGRVEPATDVAGVSTTAAPQESTAGGVSLASRETVVAALGRLGIPAAQAECVYAKIATDPAALADINSLIAAVVSGDPTPASRVSAAGQAALVASVTDCVDAASLSKALGSTNTSGDIESALAALLGIDLSKLSAADIERIAVAVAGKLGPDEVALVRRLLAGAASGSSDASAALAALAGQLGSLDLSKLNGDELAALFSALVKALGVEQAKLLEQLGKVNLLPIDLSVDPSTLSPEQLGTWLLLTAPLLTATLKKNANLPPAGGDPNEVYIPPGVDLSDINPLVFVPKEAFVAGLRDGGWSSDAAGCYYDQLRLLPAAQIGNLFSSTANAAEVAQVLLLGLGCVAGTALEP